MLRLCPTCQVYQASAWQAQKPVLSRRRARQQRTSQSTQPWCSLASTTCLAPRARSTAAWHLTVSELQPLRCHSSPSNLGPWGVGLSSFSRPLVRAAVAREQSRFLDGTDEDRRRQTTTDELHEIKSWYSPLKTKKLPLLRPSLPLLLAIIHPRSLICDLRLSSKCPVTAWSCK